MGVWSKVAWPLASAGQIIKATANPKAIKAGADDVALLWTLTKSKRPDQRLYTGEPLDIVLRQLHATARATRINLAFAILSLNAWVWLAWSAPSNAPLVFSSLAAAMIMVIFVGRAFLAALSNWQIRTGHPGTAGEFLAKADRLWPVSPPRRG